MNPQTQWMEGLPGAEIVQSGLRDIADGKISKEACLVAMVAPHLHRKGIDTHGIALLIPEPERTLYALLCRDTGDAYSHYNALKRRIVSFTRTLASRSR